VSPAGDLVYCTKEESDRPGSDGAGWLHRVGPAVGNGHARVVTGSTTRYELRGSDGVVVAVHCRRDAARGEKRIWWELPDGTKGLAGRSPESLPLYGVDRLASVAPGATVFVAEGEKATDALLGLGMVAVGTVTGAGTVDKAGRVTSVRCPDDGVLAMLVGYDVVLWPDNDEVGRRHMGAIGRRLVAMANTPRVIGWAEAPPKGDAADFVAAGYGLDDLRDLYRAAVAPAEDDAEPELGPSPPQTPAMTDMGNAQRLVARHGQDVRWCDAMGRWFRWTGVRWHQVGATILQDLAQDTVRALEEEARTGGLELAKWAKASQSGRAVASMIALTKTVMGPIAVDADLLDADSMLLGVENGVVDLRTGEGRPADRADLITKSCRAPFDDLATCPLWEDFLETIFAGDGEVIRYVQRAAGYSLTGKTGERVIFIAHGSGNNGKTTFQEVVAHILGTYAMSTPVETLIARKDRGIPNDLARLKSARFVSATESERGAKLAEAFIKTVTGGDRVTARFLHQEFFDFVPQLKLWLATNHRPEIASGGKAIWRRVRLLPFEVSIPDDQVDVDLKAKLLAEAPGILAWMVRGCTEWQRIGLKEPASIKAANTSYEEDEDVLGAFLEDRAIVDGPSWVSVGDLYAAFHEWAKAHGEEILSAKAFSQAMSERTGIKRSRQGQRGTRGFLGVRLPAPVQVKSKRTKQEDGLDD
jgi:putative DNA primase/helicase